MSLKSICAAICVGLAITVFAAGGLPKAQAQDEASMSTQVDKKSEEILKKLDQVAQDQRQILDAIVQIKEEVKLCVTIGRASQNQKKGIE